jgi:hypothetical protein
MSSVRPDVPTELVHEGKRSRVTRSSVGGRTLIRKESLGPDAAARARHEAAMLERLRGVEGVAQLTQPPDSGAIVMADAGRATLAQLAKPVPPDELTRLAEALARALAGMHERGVLHRGAPTCTPSARRSTSWRPARRRSARATRCG